MHSAYCPPFGARDMHANPPLPAAVKHRLLTNSGAVHIPTPMPLPLSLPLSLAWVCMFGVECVSKQSLALMGEDRRCAAVLARLRGKGRLIDMCLLLLFLVCDLLVSFIILSTVLSILPSSSLYPIPYLSLTSCCSNQYITPSRRNTNDYLTTTLS